MDIQLILSLLVEKGHLKQESVSNILNDKDFQKKQMKKKSSEKREGQYDPSKCSARLWNEGKGNIQCSRGYLDGECFCKSHLKEGGWWLGKISEKRPETPIHPERGEHKWTTDENGNLIDTEKTTEKISKEGEAPKKKRGRPKGSKNKNKQDTKKKKSIDDLTEEEIMKLIEKKKQRKEDENPEEKEKEKEKEKEEKIEVYVVDGVSYEIKDDEIMDPEDFSPIGKIDGSGGIIFEDEDAKEKHMENIQKYKKE
jgi:hypothetical protein